MAKEDLTLNIKADVRKATAEIKKINKTLKEFKEEQQKIQQESKKSAQALEDFTNSIKNIGQLVTLGISLNETLGESIRIGMEFEESISKLGAVSKASSQDLALLEEKARQLGEETKYSATQVADAMNYEAMAGMEVNDILTATKDILDLASVGQMDLARASDIATDTMSAFGMKADEVGKITDVMAVTITNSNTNVEQLGEAFKNVAPVAHNLGLNIEQTSAMLGVLADSGRKGGEAGTHLKIILQRLVSQTKQVQNGFKKLGISAYDSNGKLKPLTTTLKNIKSKLDGLNDQQKNEILKDLFGEEAISSANIILNNLDSMDNKLKKITNSSGEAAKMAKKMNDNLAGDKQKLNSALESLANNIYETLLPALRESVQEMTKFVQYLSENSDDLIKWGKIILETTASIYALNKALKLLALLEMATQGKNFAESLLLITNKAKTALTALMAFASANPILLTLSAIIAGVTYYINDLQESIDKLNKTTNELNKSTKNTSEFIEELYSKHFNKATKQLKLTNEEQKKYKQNVEELIKTTKKQIEQAKKNSDGSVEYKNIISELNKKLQLLKEAQKGINSAKIIQAQKEATAQTTKQKEAVKELNNEQKKLLKSLDNQLKQEVKKNQSLDEWYNHQKETITKVLSNTKEYYIALEKLDNIYQLKQEEERKKEIESFKSEYNKRVTEHSNTIKKLEDKEKQLSDKIVAINRDLQNKLKSIETQRANAIEDLESIIHNIQISGLSDYKKYLDKKKQADILYNKAKKSLQNGELSQAKRYMTKYKSLVTSLANTEIKENGRIRVSKKQSNNEAMKDVKKLEALSNEYYTLEKQKATETHNQKIAQLKAQLTATKTQLELEVQRLKLEKQMIEILTGKKVDIDTKSALDSIENLDKQIKELDKQIKPEIKIDGSKAINEINKVKKTYGELTLNNKTITITADTTPADFGIKSLITKVKDYQVVMEVNPEYTKAQEKIKHAINNFEKTPIKPKVDADTQEANKDIKNLENKIKQTKPTIKISDNTKEILNNIQKIKIKIEQTKTKYTITTNIDEVLKKIEQLKRPTHSTHTIYIKEVKQKANGGLIEPIKLATGGSADFKRKQGRIAGYTNSKTFKTLKKYDIISK